VRALAKYRKPFAQHGLTLLIDGLALLTFLLGATDNARLLTLLLTAVIVGLVWWHGRQRPTADPGLVPRVLALATLAGLWVRPLTAGGVAAAVVLLTLAATSVLDQPLRKLSGPFADARQLPGYAMPWRAKAPGIWFDATCGLALVAVVVLLTGLPPWLFAVVGALGLAAATLVGVRDVRLWKSGGVDRLIRAALDAHQPRFLVYYAGPAEGMYQIGMWLPHLERTGLPYAIFIRQEPNLPLVAELTGQPVVWVSRVASLERILPPSATAVFYVNNDGQNVDGVRFADLTHVQLGHGDSDKPSSYSIQFALFDKIFVAGQAAIDRFDTHGVLVPREKFEIVGLPQAETVRPAGERSEGVRTVLYAPTWRGGLRDMNFGSLSMGARIVRALLDLGVRVVFRPHPYSQRDSQSRMWIAQIDAMLRAAGPQHVASTQNRGTSLIDNYNESDAMVSDVSSVASLYLASGKPFAITDMGVEEDLSTAYPITRAAYILDEQDDPMAVLSAMLGDDPLSAQRAQMQRHYLGDFSASESGRVFLDAACRAINNSVGRPSLS